MTDLAKLSNRLPVTGYLDRLSARPGENLEVKVSAAKPGPCRARLVRVISGDPNPDGPGLQFEDHGTLFDHAFEAEDQPIRIGSYGEAPGPDLPTGPVCWTALICPGLAEQSDRVVLYHGDGVSGLSLLVGPAGVTALLDGEGGAEILSVPGPLMPRRWHRIWACLDPETGRMGVGFHSPAYLYEPVVSGFAEIEVSGARAPGGVVRIAMADPDRPLTGFNGRIEDPAIVKGWPSSGDEAFTTLDALGSRLIAGWDFSRAIDTQTIVGCGEQGRDGRLYNVPTRGATGARWTGRDHCWRHAPAEYGAIRFHDDDLGDLGWKTSFSFAVPDGLRSGAYALHLTGGDGEDWLPFYVLPMRSEATSSIAFLASTYTYTAYGNHARGNVNAEFRARVRDWGAYPHNPDDYPIYGRSTYNLHPDGTGISQVTRARPMLTMRPGFITFVDPKGSGLRHYPADTHLLAWLEAKGFAFDIVTDEDLDAEGAELLSRYALVLTGTHPEYHTAGTLDALQAHVRTGGRLCYLGGNGFYWRIGRAADRPDGLELRRAEGGVRAWAAEPGEYYHASDGMLGGLWKRARRDPQQLAGVGFSTQGAYDAGHFRRTAASHAPELAWMFEGVDGEILGNYGLNAGGAAGFELDRAQIELGTPANAVVVARSEGLPPTFYPAIEDLSFTPVAIGGGDPKPLVRGDMTYFEVAGGGAIFSASAITFCGSLWRDGGFDGPVSRLLENVVRHLG